MLWATCDSFAGQGRRWPGADRAAVRDEDAMGAVGAVHAAPAPAAELLAVQPGDRRSGSRRHSTRASARATSRGRRAGRARSRCPGARSRYGPAYTSSRRSARAMTGSPPGPFHSSSASITRSRRGFVFGRSDAAPGLAPGQVEPDSGLGVGLFAEGEAARPVDAAEARGALEPGGGAAGRAEDALGEPGRHDAQCQVACASRPGIERAAGGFAAHEQTALGEEGVQVDHPVGGAAHAVVRHDQTECVLAAGASASRRRPRRAVRRPPRWRRVVQRSCRDRGAAIRRRGRASSDGPRCRSRRTRSSRGRATARRCAIWRSASRANAFLRSMRASSVSTARSWKSEARAPSSRSGRIQGPRGGDACVERRVAGRAWSVSVETGASKPQTSSPLSSSAPGGGYVAGMPSTSTRPPASLVRSKMLGARRSDAFTKRMR